jgi:hypothetical protein
MPRVQNTLRPKPKFHNEDGKTADGGGEVGWKGGDKITAERFLYTVLVFVV